MGANLPTMFRNPCKGLSMVASQRWFEFLWAILGNPPKIAGEGAGKSAAKIQGAGRECWRGCCSSFLSKEKPPRSTFASTPFQHEFSQHSSQHPPPAIFWGSPFLYSVAGPPGFPRPYPQDGWDFPEAIPEKFRKDHRNALRAFPRIPLDNTAGIPQTV